MNTNPLYQKFIQLYQQKSFQQAETIGLQLLNQHPAQPQLLFILGSIAIEQAQCNKAIHYITQAIRLQPDNYQYYYLLGEAHHLNEDLEQAISAFKQANILKPRNENILNNLALFLEQSGDLNEAKKIYREMLEINPRQTSTLRDLSRLKKFTEQDDDLIAQMHTLLQDPQLDNSEQTNLHFALAKAWSDLHEYDTAFDHLAKGNAINRSTLRFDLNQTRQLFSRIQTTFNKDYFSNNITLDNDNDRPIFIVGMPRSGSTLVEQILASHPQCCGKGERPFFTAAAYNTTSLTRDNFPEFACKLSHSDLQKIGQRYMAIVRTSSDNIPYCIDKLLYNYIHIGLIRQIFPKAKIIHCLRNPLDTCFSCYRYQFGAGLLPYTYDLHETGSYYMLYRNLMRHWKQLLGDYIYEIYYEDIIDDQHEQIHRLLDFCQLPWDDACCNFHNTQRRVKTSSLHQVRQPINRKGLNTWEPYQKNLQPLIDQLISEISRYQNRA